MMSALMPLIGRETRWRRKQVTSIKVKRRLRSVAKEKPISYWIIIITYVPDETQLG